MDTTIFVNEISSSINENFQLGLIALDFVFKPDDMFLWIFKLLMLKNIKYFKKPKHCLNIFDN